MNSTITANELKMKGVGIIDSVVNENAIISVRGKEKYVVLRIADYNRMREFELEAAIQEAKADIEAGRYNSDGVDAHIRRVTYAVSNRD